MLCNIQNGQRMGWVWVMRLQQTSAVHQKANKHLLIVAVYTTMFTNTTTGLDRASHSDIFKIFRG